MVVALTALRSTATPCSAANSGSNDGGALTTRISRCSFRFSLSKMEGMASSTPGQSLQQAGVVAPHGPREQRCEADPEQVGDQQCARDPADTPEREQGAHDQCQQ